MIQLILVVLFIIRVRCNTVDGGDGNLLEMLRRMFLPELTTLGRLGHLRDSELSSTISLLV